MGEAPNIRGGRDKRPTLQAPPSAKPRPLPCSDESKTPSHLAGKVPEDLLDRRAEAHLQELIGLIEHESVQLTHVARHAVVLQEVDKPDG